MAFARIVVLALLLGSCAGCKTIFSFSCHKDIAPYDTPYQTEAKIQLEREF